MRSTTVTRQLPAALCVAAIGLFAASPALAGSDRGGTAGPLVRHSPAVPQGATARVTAVYDSAGRSTITLHVKGLEPHTEYGAHAHVDGCDLEDPGASGGHYQNTVAPEGQSGNPAYANRSNEIWLDLTTNAAGNGVARTTVAWQFWHDRRAESVVIHERHTSTAPGEAGVAGPRLACLDVDF